MAEKKGSTPVPLSEHEGVGPSQPEENTIQAEVQRSDVQKLLVTGTLTTICNNTRTMLGIIICKQWTDEYTMAAGLHDIFHRDTKVSINDYHRKVFKLLEEFGNGNGEPGQFNGLMQHPFPKLSENSVVFENAIKGLAEVSENGVMFENHEIGDRNKEMRVGLMHQLLVKSDVSLEILQNIANKYHLTTREVGEYGTNAAISIYTLLQKIIEAEQKAKETRQEKDEIQLYIDAYQQLADAFLNYELDGFHSLDKETKEHFLKVETVYNDATRLLKNSQERNSTSTQSTQTDGSSYPIDDKVLDAILEILERGATIAPQILAEQIVGVAYAIHIDRLALESNIEFHLPFNGRCHKKYYTNGVSLYKTLIAQYSELNRLRTGIKENQGQCSPGRRQEIDSLINTIDKAITMLEETKTADSDRCSFIYEQSVEDFKKQMSNGDRYTCQGLVEILNRVRSWRVGIIHELIVNMKITLGSDQLLDYITKASSKEKSAELMRQVKSSKHHLEPLRDIKKYLETFKGVFPNLYKYNSHVTKFFKEELAREMFMKYTKAFRTGWEGIQEHSIYCPKRDEELKELKKELTEVKQERVEMKQKLAATELKLAAAELKLAAAELKLAAAEKQPA